MTTSEAASLIEALATRDPHGWHTWVDPTHVATDYWRTGALSGWRGRGPDGPQSGQEDPESVAAVELWLERPHPSFKIIVEIDEIGIWYGDGHGGTPDMPVERLGLIPWWQVTRLVMHRASASRRSVTSALRAEGSS
jgi:hypothetical protein